MKKWPQEVSAAFTASLPVLTGYFTMGFAAGVLLALNSGILFSAFWAMVTSATFASGPLQFLLVDWVRSGTALTDVLVVTVCLNIRYSLYGVSLIERYKAVPFWWRLYMIGTVTDETYALQTQCPWPIGREGSRYCFMLAVFDHLYWVIGVTGGALAGSALPFDAYGIDFAMTALFLVIAIDQIREKVNRVPAMIGVVSSIIALLIMRFLFDSWKMLVPAMALAVIMLMVLRSRIITEDGMKRK